MVKLQRTSMVHLTNSLGVFTDVPEGRLSFMQISPDEFCDILKSYKNLGNLNNAIGHESTAQLISSLCGVEILSRRTSINMKPEEGMLTIKLSERLPEGKVLNREEILRMLDEGKVKFYFSRLDTLDKL